MVKTTVILLAFLTIAFGQTERWIYWYNGSHNYYDFAKTIAYGTDGNIYAAGRSWGGDTTGDDLVVVSVTSDNNPRWSYVYRSNGYGLDEAYSIVYGADGNIYLAGTTYDTTTYYDFTVISLTNTGSERWVYAYNGPGNDDENAHALAYGADGNVYAAGYSTGDESGPDFTVLSVTANGAERWVYRYHQYGRTWDDANALVYGPDGNIYAAGYSTGESGTSEDIVVSSLSNAGNENWVYRYNGPYNGYDEAFCLTYGADGYIYTGGVSSHSLETQLDLIIISLIPTGGIEEENTINRNPQTGFRISLGTFQNQNLNYALSLPEPAAVTLSLYNLQGQKVLSWQVNANQGNSSYSKNLPDLSPGVYFLNVELLGKGDKESRKLIVVK